MESKNQYKELSQDSRKEENMSDMNQGTWVENTGSAAPQNTTDQGNNVSAPMGTPLVAVPGAKPLKTETEETKRMKEHFSFFGPVTFWYAVFYAFCMFKNGSGVTFPFFVAGSLLFLCLSLSKLGITLKRGSIFYMAAIVLLGISTFCTDDGRLIFFNKAGIFLLMMSLLLKQFFNTSKWKLGKYLGAICQLVVMSFGELGRPFSDLVRNRKVKESESSKKFWYVVLGLVIGVPVLFMVLLLLASADVLFRQMTGDILKNIQLGNIFNILFRIAFIFFASYSLTSYLCKRKINEEVADLRQGEPVLAITITGLLTLLYLLFSGIQIVGLFLGQMQLPEGYTYAMYAREGFFQLLAVSLLNLVIVLICMSLFKKSKLLKAILTLMSLCTFVMIASSALRMVIYIRFYYLTFLRILVLWSLAVLALLFAGVLISIFLERFPMFRYSMAVVTLLYLALSFAHPDYIIAWVNIANAPQGAAAWSNDADEESLSQADLFGGQFFLTSEPYHDYRYLTNLSADAAPILVPYLEDLGYDLDAFEAEDAVLYEGEFRSESMMRSKESDFGYYWMRRMQKKADNLGIRTFNVSRYRMVQYFQ